jgi:hypothetical protein
MAKRAKVEKGLRAVAGLRYPADERSLKLLEKKGAHGLTPEEAATVNWKVVKPGGRCDDILPKEQIKSWLRRGRIEEVAAPKKKAGGE